MLAERGRLGFNAKVFVETGEEVRARPACASCCERDRDACAADVFIALDGPRQTTFMPEMTLGARGGVAFDLVVDCARASTIPAIGAACWTTPASCWRMRWPPSSRRAAGSWWRAGCRRQIPPAVKAAIDALVFEDIPGLPEGSADWGEPGMTKAERIFGWTSVIVLAAVCGHPDAPTNAVQGEARARLQVRHTRGRAGRDHRARTCAATSTRMASPRCGWRRR